MGGGECLGGEDGRRWKIGGGECLGGGDLGDG